MNLEINTTLFPLSTTLTPLPPIGKKLGESIVFFPLSKHYTTIPSLVHYPYTTPIIKNKTTNWENVSIPSAVVWPL